MWPYNFDRVDEDDTDRMSVGLVDAADDDIGGESCDPLLLESEE